MSSIIDEQYDKGLNDLIYDIEFEGDIIYVKSLLVEFQIDFKFWNILPNLAINFHSKSFEIEWLFFGLYFDLIYKKKYIKNM